MFKSTARSMSITSQESYSAVMIADLVAEVPVSLESEQCIVKPTKDGTNPAYDGHLDGEGKSVTADGMDTTNSSVTNGGGITRGVILNAVQFGQPDSKTKSDEKSMQLVAALPVPQLTQQISEPKGFKDMSLLRKIAFGFSFLPSVLFVLCFAIILPCNVPKPCVQETWITTFNNTEALSRLEFSENILFTASKEHKGVLKELNVYNGNEEKERNFGSRPAYLRCGKIRAADKTECVVINEEGKFYSLNESRNEYSDLLWDPISDREQPSPPVILPDCNGDLTEEIAMAVSNTNIKIMYGGSYVSSLLISQCDSFPTKLTPWTIRDSTDLVFICTKDEKGILVKVTHNTWCALSEFPQREVSVIYTGEMNSLNNGIIQPLGDVLVIWSGDEVSLIQQNGSQLWKASNLSHSEENRYILYGNFRGGNKQVAILSSNTLSGLKVTLLDATSGNQEKSYNFKDSEAIDAASVQGIGNDFILILRKVKKMTNIMTTALSQINDFTTTVANLISNNVMNTPNQFTSHELSLLDSEGKLKIVNEMRDLQNAEYKTTFKAIYDKNTDILHIYLLSTSGKNEIKKTTKVRSIDIAEWYTTKHSRCLGKMV